LLSPTETGPAIKEEAAAAHAVDTAAGADALGRMAAPMGLSDLGLGAEYRHGGQQQQQQALWQQQDIPGWQQDLSGVCAPRTASQAARLNDQYM
jgi:hypothetical protein